MPDIKLHASKFETLIQRRGRTVRWQEAILCSCWNLDSGQPNYYCRACKGVGYTYAEPIESVALVMSITQHKEYVDSAGVFDVGDAVMTVPRREWAQEKNRFNMGKFEYVPLYDVGMYDIITLLDTEYKASELLVRGTEIQGRPPDTLLNDEVLSIKSIRQANSETGETTVYTSGIDYTHQKNTIVWKDSRQPEIGELYSVTYYHRPMFTVLAELPKPRFQDNQELPKFVAMRYRSAGFDPRTVG